MNNLKVPNRNSRPKSKLTPEIIIKDDIQVEKEDVELAITKLKYRRIAVPDGITNELLK